MEAQVRSEDSQAPDSARILILDFGSQYTRLIARRVREAGVYSEIHPHDMPEEALSAFQASGIILSGGPESVAGEDAPQCERRPGGSGADAERQAGGKTPFGRYQP